MSITRGDLIVEARNMADATGSSRWLDPTILRFADLIFRREWSNILNANKDYRAQDVTATLDSDGRIALADLSTGSGDTAQTFFRVIGLRKGPFLYEFDQLENNLRTRAQNTRWCDHRFWQEGNYLLLEPYAQGDVVTVTLNAIPTKPSQLSSDDVLIDFPDPFEMILVCEVAALMLAKGGAEDLAASSLKALAEDMREDLLADVTRTTTGPFTWKYSDSAMHWNAVSG